MASTRPTTPSASVALNLRHHQQPQLHLDLDQQIDANNNHTSSSHHITSTANTTPNNASSFIASKSEKYSLRQRHKRTIIDDDDGDYRTATNPSDRRRTSSKRQNTASALHHVVRATGPYAPKNSKNTATTNAPQPIASAASAGPTPKKKPKPKAAPLSKYRRKTANARERTRMREINSAFENLRKFVPLSFCDETSASTNEKLTKITTLRLAMKYITSLNDVLHYNVGSDKGNNNNVNNVANILPAIVSDRLCNAANEPASDSDASSDSGSLGGAHSDVPAAADVADGDEDEDESCIGYGLTLNEDAKDLFKDLLMTAYGSTDTQRFGKNSENRIDSNGKHQQRHFGNAPQQHQQNYQHNKFGNFAETHAQQQQHTDAPSTHTNGVMFTNHQPYMSASSILQDIGLMFESDGESLHLSEPCFSPASGHQQNPSLDATSTAAVSPPTMSSSACNMNDSIGNNSKSSTLNSLEFGVLLADSDSDSLELTEPCLSPLAGLDVLGGPFSDLMMQTGDFGEHQHLEMYLT